jgi:hypothetical protein
MTRTPPPRSSPFDLGDLETRAPLDFFSLNLDG